MNFPECLDNFTAGVIIKGLNCLLKQQGLSFGAAAIIKEYLANNHPSLIECGTRLKLIKLKPNIVSRHNVVYVEACSFDNPLGGFVPGTKLTNKILRRSLLCKSRNNRLIRPSIPRHSSGESSSKYFATSFERDVQVLPSSLKDKYKIIVRCFLVIRYHFRKPYKPCA